MCLCDPRVKLYTNEQTTVCTNCGVETSGPLICTPNTTSYQQSHYPVFDSSYSRVKRFLVILDSVCLGAACTSDNKMLEYLDKRKLKSNHAWSCRVVKHEMKSCGTIRDKRYNSTHLFCRAFADDYVAPPQIPNWFYFRQNLQVLFSSIEYIHRDLFTDKPFMSYTWLLHKLFRVLRFNEYLQFIKILKCPKRTKVYEDNFAKIKHALCHSNRYAGDLDGFAANVQLHA
jgi:hypothetical protein